MIDLEAGAPRVIEKVVVGDGPEGLAMSPAGGYVASLILNGTAPKTAFYGTRNRTLRFLRSRERPCAMSRRPRWAASLRASPSARTGAISIWVFRRRR